MPHICGTLTNMSVERQEDGGDRILQRPLLPRLFSASVCVEFESIFKGDSAAFWCVCRQKETPLAWVGNLKDMGHPRLQSAKQVCTWREK